MTGSLAAEPISPTRRVALKDGTRVTLRPIRSQDEAGLIALHARLGPETAYQRFFAALPRLPDDWAHFLANVDYERRMAIVAVHPGDELIAVARYDHDEAANEAEIAIVVQDRWQGRGLGTILMTELLGYAESRGIRRYRAYVLADNLRMLDLLLRVTRVLERRTERGVTSLLLAPRAPSHDAEEGAQDPKSQPDEDRAAHV